MKDMLYGSIQGFVKILDKDTKEVLVDTHNDILYGNMSAALAHALLGNQNSLLSYMAFGNGGAYIGPSGLINYKSSLGGNNSLTKDISANLYNTIYVKKISNEATTNIVNANASVLLEKSTTNYEDIVVNVTLSYTEPPTGIPTTTGGITQSSIDNSTFVGSSTLTTANEFVFNELGLFAGTNNIFDGDYTTTTNDISLFTTQSVNYNTASMNSKSKLMLSHVIFHPIQKSANRQLQIVYTLRIQMGAR